MPRASILLRYTVIAATACLVVVEGRSGGRPWGALAILALASAANAMTGIVPPMSRGRAFTAAVIAADALWLGVALATTRRFGADFFAVYFFVLLLAAIADDPALGALAAGAACGAYLHVLSLGGATWLRHSPSLLRVPLLLAAAMLCGSLVDSLRRERRRAMADVTAAVARGQLLAALDHALDAPIAVVADAANGLLHTRLEPAQRQGADRIRRAADSVRHMMERVRELSRLETGAADVAATPFSLSDLCAEVMEELATGAERKGVEVAYHIDPAVPDGLRGDPDRLRRVLLNLVDNAVKFTAQGEIVLRARLTAAGARGGVLRVDIADTGAGVAADRCVRLFEPFWRRDAAPGTGLGLAIGRQLVTAMGGEIGVVSEPGSGSTFWFTVRVAWDGPGAAPAARTAPPRLRTLVVDDSPAARAILEQELRAWGARTNGADDGATALARLRSGFEQDDPYAVAVVDACMPGTSGPDLVRAIAADPRLRALAVVLLTSAGAPDPDAALPANVVATVSKPVNGRRLRDAVAAAAAHARTPVSAGWSARRSRRAAGS
jgi:signal transduction histidine kinase/CheY-like chemotaxis protein